jgi:hypothetical protein
MVEGAVFAETIPFTETRDYVKNVMSNATYYAALFTGRPQSLKERLGAISPYSDMPIDQDLNQNGNTNPNLSLSTSLSTESPR